MIPYVTPTDLLGDPTAPLTVSGPNDQAPLGINFSTIALARIWDMCHIATTMVDTIAAQTLRGDSVYDELSGPGHRLAFVNGGITARFLTSRKPILSVVSGQYAFGSPPWQWNPITVANIVPEQPPFSDALSAANWEAANPGQAALLIGGSGWGWGNGSVRVGIRYLSGWPVTGLLPSAAPSATFTASSATCTVPSATGIAEGAPVSSSLLPAGTTVLGISGTTLTLSAEATASGTAVLSVGYAPGVTVLNVDDVTTWGLGIKGSINDGVNTESVTSLSVSSSTMTPTPIGPGTMTLTTATLFPHLPAVALSAMPGVIRWATMLAVKVQALQRGATAVTSQSTPGRSTSAGSSAIKTTKDDIRQMLLPYRRVY